MAHITFDYSKVLDKFVAPHEVDNLQAQVTVADEMIRKGTGPGADFLGWRDLPENYDREEFDRILKAAEKIKEESEVLVSGMFQEQLAGAFDTKIDNNSFLAKGLLSRKKQMIPKLNQAVLKYIQEN